MRTLEQATIAQNLDVSRSQPDSLLNVKQHGVSGSNFETPATPTADPKKIVVENPGDFIQGQDVLISGVGKCDNAWIWPAEQQQSWQSDMPVRPIDTMYHSLPDYKVFGKIEQHHRELEKLGSPLGDEVELKGYDGSLGRLSVYIIEIINENVSAFRWSDDTARTWKGMDVKITREWQALSGGLQIKFNTASQKWKKGDALIFDARDGSLTTIEEINGKEFILKEPLDEPTGGITVRHEDSRALQNGMDKAISENLDIHIPAGNYRLLRGISVLSPRSIRIEGDGVGRTILDMSEGIGSCFWLFHGERVEIKNLKVIGHTSKKLGLPFSFRNITGRKIWRTHALKPARAVEIRGTNQLLVEDVHVEKIACECFYSQGPEGCASREDKKNRTDSITYSRCFVKDCGFNAFNNNDVEENTSILNCRIVDVANAAWEGPARYIKFIGNYVRGSGSCSIGNLCVRHRHIDDLGCGQSIFANNIFEGSGSNRIAIYVSNTSTQVVIKNNIFVNYNGTAIGLYSRRSTNSLPAGYITVSGNIIDLSNNKGPGIKRSGIEIGASDAIVSDNQIYDRRDDKLKPTGILILDPARNIQLHNNTVKNCGKGIYAHGVFSKIGDVVDERSFKQVASIIPPERYLSHCYRDWRIEIISADGASTSSVIEYFDPVEMIFHLCDSLEFKSGDAFTAYPDFANWSIHDNTIDSCVYGIVLRSMTDDTRILKNNTISATASEKPSCGIIAEGGWRISGNTIAGFSGSDSIGLFLRNGIFSKKKSSKRINDNLFTNCASAVVEAAPGIWHASDTTANQFSECRTFPVEGSLKNKMEPSKIQKNILLDDQHCQPILKAMKLSHAMKLDESILTDSNTIDFNRDPDGWLVDSLHGCVSAAWNGEHLILTAKINYKSKIELTTNSEYGDWCKGDGMGLSFRATPSSPLIKFFGMFDGTFRFYLPEKIGRDNMKLHSGLNKVSFSASTTSDACRYQWVFPLELFNVGDAGSSPKILLNTGFYNTTEDTWITWVPDNEIVPFGFMFSNNTRMGKLQLV